MHGVSTHQDGLFLLPYNRACEDSQLYAGEREFSNYSSFQMMVFFESGTSHKILMVSSLWNHRIIRIHPCGLVPKWMGLRCQFRGDWFQRIASVTSESDSNTFAGEDTQCHLSYYSFGLTTDMNSFSLSLSLSQNPPVPTAQGIKNAPGARNHYYLLLFVC